MPRLIIDRRITAGIGNVRWTWVEPWINVSKRKITNTLGVSPPLGEKVFLELAQSKILEVGKNGVRNRRVNGRT